MLLNPYLYKDTDNNKFISDESLKKAGIIYRKRKIYIMKKYAQECFDAGSIFNSFLMNNVLVINISKTKLDNGLYRNIKSIYSFMYTSTKGETISRFLDSRLALRYCITSGYDCDETYIEGDFEDSNYYNDLGFTFGYDENNNPVEVNIDDMLYEDNDIEGEMNEKLKIPDPRYYTNRQYREDGNIDSESFVLMRQKYYNTRDLIDETTDVYLVKEDEADKLNTTQMFSSTNEILPMNQDRVFDNWEKIKDAQELPFDMFILNTQSCFSSYKFIYDSKTNTFNIKDSMINKTVIKSRNSDYISLITKRMRKYCNKLAKIYGNIRVYYYSSDISDTIEIIFDDDNHNKIKSTFDKNSMFDRLMIFVNDKYSEYIGRPLMNYDDINFLSLA